MEQPRIGIIIVHPNGSYDHTYRCLETLRSMSYSNKEIIVVDNGSKDDSSARLKHEFPSVFWIRSESNVGFAGGNNIGIEYTIKNNCRHILLLNNDTLVTPSFIEPLIERLESDDSIGAESGKIYYYPAAVGG